MKKIIVALVVGLIIGVLGTYLFNSTRSALAEQSSGSPESGITSYIKTVYDDLVALGFGSDADVPDWGTFWNRIKTAAKWIPSGDAGTSGVLSGTTFYNNSRTQRTGTMPDREGDNVSTAQSAAAGLNYLTAPEGYYDGGDRVSATNAQIAALASDLLGVNIKSGYTIFGVAGTYPAPAACSTQQYHDSYGAPATEVTNCSLTWTTAPAPVSGDDNYAGRGGYDPRTGLIWSQQLTNSGGTVIFSAAVGSVWSWDASAANNIAVGNKTASQLCSERGNGWRLPTQKEIAQASIDGANWNLTNTSASVWALTEFSAANAWYVILNNGYSINQAKTNTTRVRCVR